MWNLNRDVCSWQPCYRHGSPPILPNPMPRIVTYNVHRCVGNDRRLDVPRVAAERTSHADAREKTEVDKQ